MTLINEARSASYVEQIALLAKAEELDYESLRRRVSSGRVVVPRNNRRDSRIIGIGEGLRTKVNVNIGTSSSHCDLEYELLKAEVAVENGADALMDLSTCGDLDETRRRILYASSGIPVGTVPVYQAWIYGVERFGNVASIPPDWFIEIVERHLRDGVDFMTIHAGLTRELAVRALKSSRIMPIVSRGGSMVAAWMLETNQENPFLRYWGHLLEIFGEYDAVISLGDALRPGTLFDAHDELQLLELVHNAKLAREAVDKGIQVMIEGPGHMRLDLIAHDVRLTKRLSNGVPYYVLGPVVTDIAAGYDHISAAIGAAVASASGADFICYVTPSEHLGLPTVEQVKEGLIAARIAAHAGDLVKLGRRAHVVDLEMSMARANLDWKTQISRSIDPNRAREILNQFGNTITKSCSMCGVYCVFLVLEKFLKDRRIMVNEDTTAGLDSAPKAERIV